MTTRFKAAVVVVEDDPLNLRLYSEILPIGGFRAVSSSDGAGIEDVIARERPVAVLLDIDLPLRSGVEIAASIRSDPRIADVPLWAISASADSVRRFELIAEGFDEAIAKPISVLQLISGLSALLDLRPPNNVTPLYGGAQPSV